MSACTPAPPGSYSPANASAPIGCAAGTYAAVSGLSACPLCPTGGYCPANASSVTPCPTGTYRSILGGGASIQCAPCPLGQACPVPGLTLGINCSEGLYANATGLSSCFGCPLVRPMCM